jgi:hypothetical protein
MKESKTLLLIALSLCLTGMAIAEQVTVTKINEGIVRLKAKDKASGKPLWSSQLNSRRIKTAKGDPFLYMEENGSGIHDKDQTFKTWKTVTYLRIDGDYLIPYSIKRTMKDKNGKVVQTLEKSYNAADGKVYCTLNGQTKTFDFKSDLIDTEMLGPILTNYPSGRKEISFHMLTHELAMYKITMKYLGDEPVNGAACYKLQMVVDLGALNLISGFVPKTYFWYQKAYPNDFARYEGLESDLGTPYIVMEAVP